MRLLMIHLILPPEVCDTISASSSRSDLYPHSIAQILRDSAACGPAQNWASAAVLVPYAALIPTDSSHRRKVSSSCPCVCWRIKTGDRFADPAAAGPRQEHR